MKATKITYWVSTAIVALMMTFSGIMYLTNPAVQQGFQHLGYPGYFRVELAFAKFIGAAVLLLPVAARAKEWAYAGFAIVFISAVIAHTASGDPVQNRVMPAVFFALMIVSYVTYHKKEALKIIRVN